MKTNILIDTFSYFYSLNSIPLWVVGDDKILYSSIGKHFLNDKAFEVLRNLTSDDNYVKTINKSEYLAQFPIKFGGKKAHLFIATAYSTNIIANKNPQPSLLPSLLTKEHFNSIRLFIPYLSRQDFINYCTLLYKITNNKLPSKMHIEDISDDTLNKAINKKLTKFVFETREERYNPYSPEGEKYIMELVKNGDIKSIKKLNIDSKIKHNQNSQKYIFNVVALITLVTRSVLEAGVDTVEAYGLSDLFLEYLSKAETPQQITDISNNILLSFTQLVQNSTAQKAHTISPYLSKAERYIKSNLHFPIRLADVASYVGISEKYLSRLFATQHNMKFSQFVSKCRVDEAKQLLINSNYSLVEIAYSLAFSSESYFIKIFNDFVGTTPQKYRNAYLVKY